MISYQPTQHLLERFKDAELFEKLRDAEKKRKKEKLERLFRLRDWFIDLESILEDGAISPKEFGVESEKVDAELKEEVGGETEMFELWQGVFPGPPVQSYLWFSNQLITETCDQGDGALPF